MTNEDIGDNQWKWLDISEQYTQNLMFKDVLTPYQH